MSADEMVGPAYAVVPQAWPARDRMLAEAAEMLAVVQREVKTLDAAVDQWRERAWQAEAERDAATKRAERAEAEIERLRAVVGVARLWASAPTQHLPDADEHLRAAVDAYDRAVAGLSQTGEGSER